jgi:serine/threonine-protein kinase
MPKARAAAEKALSLDSSLGHAYWASGTVSMLFDRDWEQAEKYFRQALLLQPSDCLARGWYATYLAYIARRPDEALQHARLGESADPLAGWPKMFLGMVLLALRRFGEARAKLQELVELEPLLWTAQRMLGMALYCEGRLEDAIAVFGTAMTLSGGHPWLLSERAEVLAECGRPEEAEAVYRELTDRSRRQWVSPTTIGILAGVLGKDDEAFALLERAVVERESVVCVYREWPGPGTKRLRGDPRWEALLKRAGL